MIDRRPSWEDYATHDESRFPELWDGCIGAWCPGLGPSGNSVFDLSVGKHVGSLENLTLSTAWIYDTYPCLAFTGVTGSTRQCVRLVGTGGVSLTGGLEKASILALVKLTGTVSSSASIFYESNATSGYTKFGLYQVTSNYFSFIIRDTNTGSFYGVTTNQSFSGWCTVVGAFNSITDNIILYVNGLYQGINNSAMGPIYASTVGSPTAIGAFTMASGSDQISVNARIADIRIYNRVISAEEAELYEKVRLGVYAPRSRRRFISAHRFNPAIARNSNILIPGIAKC